MITVKTLLLAVLRQGGDDVMGVGVLHTHSPVMVDWKSRCSLLLFQPIAGPTLVCS